MLPEDQYFQTNDVKKVWKRYCGFLDISVNQFMEIQERLLMEQMETIAGTPLGKKIMGAHKVDSVDEFRKHTPLTRYEDYEPYLSNQDETVLAEKPLYWCHSSGRGGHFKWIPYTKRGFEVFGKRAIAAIILAGADDKASVKLKPNDKMLLLMPPPPYTSGSAIFHLSQRFSMDIIPPIEQTINEEFADRIASGFRIAVREGVAVIFSIASVLVKTGERMTEEARGMPFSWGMLKPRVLSRLVTAWVRSKAGRRPILPKDIWKTRAILTGGLDTSIYRDQIVWYWGHEPYEVYGATEAFPLALQGWNTKNLTLVPDVAFWEFIPMEELQRAGKDPAYQPATVLFDQVEEGRTYEVVLTHFYGMPLLRYRLGDLVTFVSTQGNDNTRLPQLVFKARMSDTINLGGLTDLDESVLWQAINKTGISYEDWAARKEYNQHYSRLAIYIEPREACDACQLNQQIDRHLKELDIDYRDVEAMLGDQPIDVTILSPGTFQRYYEKKCKEGADLAHLKPPHMNATDEVIQEILHLS